ncbi:MAG TPA: ASCH domain-containing protein [Desulfomonilia bacterium]|nr:ASCH domain-containing protein [Desulfomonilia bacterium]
MFALSIRQPWAWLIVHGGKDVENRTWRTDIRGRFLIHAGYVLDEAGHAYVKKHIGIDLPDPDALKRGGIIGFADLTDCVAKYESPWFTGPYGFVLSHAKPLPFIAIPGKPGFFDVDLPPEIRQMLDLGKGTG